MAKKLTWDEQGYSDAMEGLPSDPPMHPRHGSYINYRNGYHRAERDLERERERHRGY